MSWKCPKGRSDNNPGNAMNQGKIVGTNKRFCSRSRQDDRIFCWPTTSSRILSPRFKYAVLLDKIVPTCPSMYAVAVCEKHAYHGIRPAGSMNAAVTGWLFSYHGHTDVPEGTHASELLIDMKNKNLTDLHLAGANCASRSGSYQHTLRSGSPPYIVPCV